MAVGVGGVDAVILTSDTTVRVTAAHEDRIPLRLSSPTQRDNHLIYRPTRGNALIVNIHIVISVASRRPDVSRSLMLIVNWIDNAMDSRRR